MSRCQFGGKLTKALTARYAQSPHWSGGKFVNLEPTSSSISYQELPNFVRKQLRERDDREPTVSLPVDRFRLEDFLNDHDSGWKSVWFGHSALLLRIAGLSVFVDPMLGPNAAPISPVPVKRYSAGTLDLIADLPEIDLLLLTHDHYDHLDYESIRQLRPKVKRYVVPLGVGRHLVAWGVPEKSISECDRWDQLSVDGLNLTFTPSRHFSGRGLTDQAKSLWGGWVVTSATEKIWFSGDGGYGSHFRTVGDRLGPFDFAFMECGQYNEMWRPMHMFPEESVRAAIEAKVRLVMPIHWGAFTLAQHTWREPVEQFCDEAERLGLPLVLPRLGELLRWPFPTDLPRWWREVESASSTPLQRPPVRQTREDQREIPKPSR